jgi:quercetin dioxygenase-like cupin family protein
VTFQQAQQVTRGSDEGEALWILGGLYTFKALNAESAAYALVEVKAPDGFAIPVHYHEHEEEGFYVAQGEATIFLGDQERRLAAGAFALAPRGVPHAFRLESADTVLVLLLSPGPAHEAMFREMGEPARDRVAPPASSAAADPAQLAAVAASYGTRIVGPPPTR